jgi:hypothetical protein
VSAKWRSRLRLGGAILLGAAAVGAIWFVSAGGGSTATASFQVSPGISPVVFLYLDNGHIASYLAQLQGGAATTEQLSRQAGASRNATVGANGVGVGGSSSQESTAALSLTVTNQSRFTSLLDLLQADGFLHPIDMAASDPVIKRELADVPAGTFVKLTNCSLELPTYVQDEQLWRAAKGRLNAFKLFEGNGPNELKKAVYNTALDDRARSEGKNPPPETSSGEHIVPFQKGQPMSRARPEMNRLVRRVGTNPLVPLSSCSPEGYDPNGPDLLMPIRLGAFSGNQAVLAGPVTLVAKVMLPVRRSSNFYVDLASLQQWARAGFWTTGELKDDATVIPPGYVLQPIAIYK